GLPPHKVHSWTFKLHCILSLYIVALSFPCIYTVCPFFKNWNNFSILIGNKHEYQRVVSLLILTATLTRPNFSPPEVGITISISEPKFPIISFLFIYFLI